MEVSSELTLKFSDWVIPHIGKSGCFGQAGKIVNFKTDPDRKGQDQFSSAVEFYEIKVQLHDILKDISVLVKYQIQDEDMRKCFFMQNHFHNELKMYSEILPIIDKDGIVNEIFPKYYHGMVDEHLDSDNDYIVLEDLSKKGFRLSTDKIFLDYDHCKLALKEIGRFHALSYIAKETKCIDFMAAVSNIKEKWTTELLEQSKYMLEMCGKRGVLPLIENEIQPEVLREFIKKYDDPAKFYKSLVEPVEPEAVLCHGDFCRNNMLFSYDDSGKPDCVKFFDLQTPLYSSPVVDLSFFLLMNTSKETREKYWDEFLNIYSESVKSVAGDKVPELDFSRVGVYGYIHCSFFIPIMLKDQSKAFSIEEYMKLTPYEQGYYNSTMGGSTETQYLVDIIQFLLNRRYIH